MAQVATAHRTHALNQSRRDEFQRLEALFHTARGLDPEDRAAWLEELRAKQPDTERELRALLDEDADDDTFCALRPESPPLSDAHGAVLEPGTLVGPFTVVRVVASGGMGTVYEARQEHPNRSVALKMMRSGLGSAALRHRFALEAEVLGILNHPGIAHVYEAGLHPTASGDVPYFAMELIDGVPLTEAARAAQLGLRARLELIASICDAIAHAHQRGVVHRDLKPANVLVDRAGQVKILDFGVARFHEKELGIATLSTTAGEILGTLAYMSPEQTLGDPHAVDTRTDVYAIGVMLYELLAGKPPHAVTGIAIFDALTAIRDHEAPRLGLVDPALRGDVETIAARAIEKDKEQRYATASELAADIRRALANEPILARPPSAVYRARKFVRRHLAAVTMAGLALVSLVTGLCFAISERNRANHVASLAVDEAAAKTVALEKLQRLSDQKLVDQLVARAADLWPAEPPQLPALTAWRDEARSLLTRLGMHVATLNDLRKRARWDPATSTAPPRFGTTAEQWEHDLLAKLVDDLSAMTTATGTLTSIEERMEFAAALQRRSIDDHREAWERCAREVAADPRFRGLKLVPQVGLVPLGANPASKLQEFLHLRTHVGPIPTRTADGTLPITESTGIVLVLLPGGETRIGAQAADEFEARFDGQAAETESPVTRVRLDPFFISKFEMSLDQWARATEHDPNPHAIEIPKLTVNMGETLSPLGWASHVACRLTLPHLGLKLPTEAQWEYAARGDTDSPWWTGRERESLRGSVNIADLSAKRAGATWRETMDWPDFDDGFPRYAPINSLRANPFGLHHVYGNVAEWCEDRLGNYANGFRDGDGLIRDAIQELRVARGGSLMDSTMRTRSSHRNALSPSTANGVTGARPVRALTGG